MAEFDTVVLYNPTDEDYTHGFNGEPYTIEANTTKSFAQFVGFHLAKHLATKMVEDSISKKDKKEKPIMVAQKLIYDNPDLRIALYKILKNKELVQKVIAAYPYKGFVGEMSIYEDFVNKEETPKETPKEIKKDIKN